MAFIAGAVVILYLIFYGIAGRIAVLLIPGNKDQTDLPYRILIGFFSLHFLFFLAAIPMKLLLMPLSALSITWACMLTGLLFLYVLLEGRQLLQKIRQFLTRRPDLSDPSIRCQLLAIVILLAAILFLVWTVNSNDETYAIWDQSYYMGDTATSVYTNTISQYDPYTGYILKNLNSEYLLETYQNLSACMSQLLHIHPMLEVMTVMASVVVILYQLIIYELGLVLFHKNAIKSALMVCFVTLFNAYSYNLFTAGEFLFIRPAEGKTILAVLILPVLFLLFLRLAEDIENKTAWLHMFLVVLGCFGLNMSSIFMIPFEISAFFFPLAIRRRKFSILLGYLLLLIPCLIVGVIYLYTKNHLLIYTAQ